MAQHEFRLQRVLNFRHDTVERLKLELATALRSLAVARRRLAELDDAEQRLLAELANYHRQPCSVSSLVQVGERLELARHRIFEQMAVIERLDEEAAAARRRLESASREEKALEQLRERQLAEYRLEERHLEQAQTAELASARHLRRRTAR